MYKRFKHTLKQIFTLPQRMARFEEHMSTVDWRLGQLEGKQRMNGVYALRRTQDTEAPSVLNRYELSILSQNGEDGMVFYLFSLLGTTNRWFVEFGIEDGRECNTGNLSLNFGWQGLLIEGSADYVQRARQYYSDRLGARRDAVRVVNAFVQPDNINPLFQQNNVPAEIDLLSIDIDGNDYWVWQALDATSPRVVVIEYNASLGAERSLSTCYDARFDRWQKDPSGYYHGASLAALHKLGAQKGYALVGCDSRGVSAFFVRQDVAAGKVPALTPQQAFFSHFQRLESLEAQFARIEHLPFESV
ncbi:MAG: hypothetical protein HXY40_19510 [Chloroflexi bacterium]|nr:hypothetical protein [Chloroflexota bacterium]